MNDIRPPRRRGDKDGIAIVIVLGLLSLLMIVAVAFSISMRIERSAAGNYANSVYAKHLVWVALGRAMTDVDEDMNANTNGFTLYPQWDVLPSGASDTGAARVTIGVGSALDYLPDSLTNAAASTNSGWQTIETGSNGVIGRYAYLVVNMSGLLDANKMGNAGGIQRAWGTNAAEIQLGGLVNEGWSASDPQDFLDGRLLHGRYETMSELLYLNAAMLNNGDQDFVTYSMAPGQKYLRGDGRLTNQVYVGGNLASLQTNKTAILQALKDSGVGGIDSNSAVAVDARNTVYSNLLDYVDTDCVPTNLGAGCTERVPMINEVIATCDTGDGVKDDGSFTFEYSVRAEYVFPFGIKFTNGFKLWCETTLEAVPPDNTDASFIPPSPTIRFEQTFLGEVGAGTFSTVISTNTWTANGNVGNTNNMKLRFAARTRAKIMLTDAGNTMVDCVPYPDAPGDDSQWIYGESKTQVLQTNQSVTVDAWAECLDPRFNWDADNSGDYQQWFSGREMLDRSAVGYPPGPGLPGLVAAPSPAAENLITLYYLKMPAKFTSQYAGLPETILDGLDGEPTAFHVADRPLVNAGELGYLAYAPMQTVRLYEHTSYAGTEPRFHRVLDRFTMLPSSIQYRRGLVNINTTNVNVLATVLFGVPEREYVTGSPSNSWATAKNVAARIVANRPYRDLSDLGEVVTDWWPATPVKTEIARESLIRNSVGLLTVRQNLFTILFITGTTSRGLGLVGSRGMGDWLSYQRSAAVVWRDPFPTITPEGTTNHWWYIKSLTTVDD